MYSNNDTFISFERSRLLRRKFAKNPGFEVLQDGKPVNWQFNVNLTGGAVFSVDAGVSHTGELCFHY